MSLTNPLSLISLKEFSVKLYGRHLSIYETVVNNKLSNPTHSVQDDLSK